MSLKVVRLYVEFILKLLNSPIWKETVKDVPYCQLLIYLSSRT